MKNPDTLPALTPEEARIGRVVWLRGGGMGMTIAVEPNSAGYVTTMWFRMGELVTGKIPVGALTTVDPGVE
jgi:uncharacterized protein YodC (DUF2158 family)